MGSADAHGAQLCDLFARASAGDQVASRSLESLLYEEVKALARKAMAHESPGHTLQPTALVHEVFLKMSAQTRASQNLGQFKALVARQIRRILIDHARRRGRSKRGGGERPVCIDGLTVIDGTTADQRTQVDLLAMDEALERLQALDPRQASIVNMRFFGGMTHEEIAAFLGISASLVEKEWRAARGWLQGQLEGTRDHGRGGKT